ncbi:hypothetical protein WKI71_29690 [Streptomyces sp. MS1.AVA.1]|uniref:Uncharacterized protein n=1 Tax=Streptomyces machairae TaxID=3134109 RepID=A0ABU8UR32_9ACTN
MTRVVRHPPGKDRPRNAPMATLAPRRAGAWLRQGFTGHWHRLTIRLEARGGTTRPRKWRRWFTYTNVTRAIWTVAALAVLAWVVEGLYILIWAGRPASRSGGRAMRDSTPCCASSVRCWPRRSPPRSFCSGGTGGPNGAISPRHGTTPTDWSSPPVRTPRRSWAGRRSPGSSPNGCASATRAGPICWSAASAWARPPSWYGSPNCWRSRTPYLCRSGCGTRTATAT